MHPFDSKTIMAFGQQVSSRNAVNPTLWACLVVSLPLFFLTTQVSGWLSVAFFIVALVPIVMFACSYTYMLFKSPNLLRSEDFHLRAEAMGLFGDKDNPLNAGASDVVAVINNPTLPAPDQQKYLHE